MMTLGSKYCCRGHINIELNMKIFKLLLNCLVKFDETLQYYNNPLMVTHYQNSYKSKAWLKRKVQGILGKRSKAFIILLFSFIHIMIFFIFSNI